jgi:alpha/beta superfamily hydrolase
MTERLRVPGPRDVRATLDSPEATEVVVACPPHPQMGGDRRDSRLRAVSDALADRSLACLRFDYGPWDEGRGEVTDCSAALAWARDNFQQVGLFGYSFGGAVALRAAAGACDEGTPPAAVSVLAPAGTLAGESVAENVDAVTCPLQVVYGERDDTVDSLPVVERARDHGGTVERVPADHFYAGQLDDVAETVGRFLGTSL